MQRLLAHTFNRMQRVRRNANHIANADWKLLSLRADAQCSPALQDVKDLLGIIVLMQRRRFPGPDDHHEHLGRFRIRPVHHQIIDVRRKLVTLDLRSWKNKLHRPMV